MPDIYKIGVSIALHNGISPALAIIGRDLLGLKTKIGDIEKSFGGWARAIGGVAGIMAGSGLIEGVAKIAKHGEELLNQQEKLMRSGVSLNATLGLQADYYERIAKAIPTSTGAEYLKTLNELRAVTGSVEGATNLAPKALMVDTLLSNTFGHESHGEYYKLLRSAEMKGISTDAARLEQFTDAAFSYITAFGGKLTAGDFQTLARRGGTAFMNTDIAKALGPIAVLTADLGGDAAGTALMTLQQLQMGANTLSKQQATQLAELGLLDMSKATKTGFGGGRLQLQPGAIKGSLQHVGDLPGWIKDVVYPALEKASHGDEQLLQNLIAKIAPNRNSAKLIEMFGNPHFLDQISKDLGLAAQVMSIERAYQSYITKNPKGVRAGFDEQFESMMQAIGSPMMQAAIPAMKAVTDIFTAIGQFANANPEAIKIVGEALAAVGVALIIAGGIALASLVGLPALIVGTAAALGVLAALNWDKIKTGVMGVLGIKQIAENQLWETYPGSGAYVLGPGTWMDSLHRIRQGLVETFSSLEGWKRVVVSLGEVSSWIMAAINPVSLVFKIGEMFKSEFAKLPGMIAGEIAQAVSGIASAFKAAIGHLFGGNAPIGDPGDAVSPIPQSFPAPSGGVGSMMQKANWMPPGRSSQPIQITTAINIDGRALSEVVSERLADLFTYPNSAASHEGMEGFSPQDWQATST
jgi:hypothetical protein